MKVLARIIWAIELKCRDAKGDVQSYLLAKRTVEDVTKYVHGLDDIFEVIFVKALAERFDLTTSHELSGTM